MCKFILQDLIPTLVRSSKYIAQKDLLS